MAWLFTGIGIGNEIDFFWIDGSDRNDRSTVKNLHLSSGMEVIYELNMPADCGKLRMMDCEFATIRKTDRKGDERLTIEEIGDLAGRHDASARRSGSWWKASSITRSGPMIS